MLPTFLILGAPKSGTSSLARYLSDHPQAWVAPEKELRFFDYTYDQGLEWYRDRLAAGSGHRAVGEATPTYLFHPQARRRIAKDVPDARLVVLMRDPVDRAYSHYWHWFERMGEKRTFEQCVEDELAGKADGGDGKWLPDEPERFPYLAYGDYLPQLQDLCARVPREQVLVLLFEDLRDRPVETFAEVCRHLGIDDTTVPESVGVVENSFRYYYPRWLWSLFVRVKLGRLLPGRVAARLYRAMVRTADPYPPMDAALRRRLEEHFAPRNAALEQWLGREISAWSRPRLAPAAA